MTLAAAADAAPLPVTEPQSNEPALVGCQPPPERMRPFWQSLFGLPDNQFEELPRAVYEQPVWETKNLLGLGGKFYFIHDPIGVKRVLLDNVANYPKHEMERKILGGILGDGLLVSEGATWKAHRRLMAPSFDFKSLVGYVPAMVAAANRMGDGWDAKGAGAEIDIADAMTHLTLEVISGTMFSAEGEELGALVDSSLRKVTDLINFSLLDVLPVIGPPRMARKMARIQEHFGAMDATIAGLIKAREKEKRETPRDLLDRLMAARDPETGLGLSDREVRDEVVIIFLAGHDTTALALTYTFYLLAQHPKVEAKLHAELARVLGGRLPVHEDLVNLPYTKMVIEESMRLYPPAPGISNRVALEDDEVSGVKIPKGSQVMISPWVLHRHRKLWENPMMFDPERFSPERSAGRHRFAYIPFSAGPRICIGMALAMNEAQLILATLAQRFRLALVPDQKIVLQHRITMRPKDGIQMRLQPRN